VGRSSTVLTKSRQREPPDSSKRKPDELMRPPALTFRNTPEAVFLDTDKTHLTGYHEPDSV
jgi:hypothetical protein